MPAKKAVKVEKVDKPVKADKKVDKKIVKVDKSDKKVDKADKKVDKSDKKVVKVDKAEDKTEKVEHQKSSSAERIKKTTKIPSRHMTSTITSIMGPAHVMHIDPLKQQLQVVNMTSTMKGLFPDTFLPRNKVDLLCWWCRHQFDSCPVGLPISHHDEQKYDKRITPECYQTDGIFCSFPCALAYLWENRKNIMYKDSNALLHEMYHRIFNETVKIPVAKSWKLLRANGGDMSINAFRNSYDETMVLTPNLATMLYQIPVGQKVFIT